MSERGEMSLTGLLVAMVLFALVSWATLTTFAQSQQVARGTQVRGDAQDTARRASDALARELRNLAGPTQSQPQALERTTSGDLVFQVIRPSGGSVGGANVMRVRYCLDGRVLRRMEQPPESLASGMPPTTACDGSGWTNMTVAAADVTNGARPVFTYNSATSTATTFVRADLWIDPDPGRGTGETTIGTGVHLRNQNRRPTAVARATPAGAGVVVLNGTASYDPEGDTLTYQWIIDGTPIEELRTPVYWLSGQTPGTPITVTLEVRDSSDLVAVSDPVTVTP